MTCTECNRAFSSTHALAIHRGRFHKRPATLPGRRDLAPVKPIEGLPWLRMPETPEACVAASGRAVLIAASAPADETAFWRTLYAHLAALADHLRKRAQDEIPGARAMGERKLKL